MSITRCFAGSLLLCLAIAGCGPSRSAGEMSASSGSIIATTAAESAEDVQLLEVGDAAPALTLRTPEDRPFNLDEAYRQQPTVLIFFRGGWCPYCARHLMEVATVEEDLRGMGFQIIAISPDQPSVLSEGAGNEALHYQLLSDSDMKLARAFGLAFTVDDATIEKYRGYGIDLEKASGHDHHQLPVPAVYIIDEEGVIRFAHSEADYKLRLSGEQIVIAANAVTAER